MLAEAESKAFNGSIKKSRFLCKEGTMAVEKTGEKYRCNVCGNEVTVTKVGGGELVCCKKPMEKIEG
jgi:desulfoferrodoxin-like iron-binding protein